MNKYGYHCNSIILSSTCFEQPSVHPQEDLYMQFYGIFSCICISSLVEVGILHVQIFLRRNI